jgi:hypothetical protein
MMSGLLNVSEVQSKLMLGCAAAVVFVVFLLVLWGPRLYSYDKRLKNLHVGMTTGQVESLLGQPSGREGRQWEYAYPSWVNVVFDGSDQVLRVENLTLFGRIDYSLRPILRRATPLQ